ncbi:4-coumarate--CoA ligase 1 [Sergentomyia squamirostris]
MFHTSHKSNEKVWFGRNLAPFHHESVSVGRAIYYTLSMNREKVVQISDNNDMIVTNGVIFDQMICIASNLIDRGAKRDSVIAIMARNGHLIAPTIFASFVLAIPVNTLDPNYSVDEAAHMFSQTKPNIVFCDYENYEIVRSANVKIGNNMRIINFGERIQNIENIDDYLVKTGREKSVQIVDVDAKTCALILCSSGSTGLSKGVRLSHQHLLHHLGRPTLWEDWEGGIVFCFSSLYWYTGLTTLLTTTLLGMTRIITTENFSADLLLKIVQKYKVTHLISTPMHVAMLLDHKSLTPTTLISVRQYMMSGSILPKDFWSKMKLYLKNGFVQIAYGMSEVGFVALQNQNTKAYCVGHLAPCLKIKVVDENNQSLSTGEIGELCFKSPYTFLGYAANEKATREMIDEDGWIHSGDIGKMDENGCLHVIDRKKEILKYSNHHVSPSEIEGIIISHPDVSFVSVVGIPDRVCTDLPAAVIVRKEGASVSEKEISELVASKLSDPKHLRGGVFFVDQLPLTPSGKVKKAKVKEMAIEFYGSFRH